MNTSNSLTSYTNVTEVARSATFQFGAFQLNVVTDDSGMYWFNANEVCSALEFGNPSQAIKTHVDEDDLQKLEVIDNLGRNQQANHINESGLYTLVFGSTKSEAKKFKRWVTSEVLPAIRKTGSYIQVTEAAKAKLLIEVKHDYAENLKHSPEHELGDALLRAIKGADEDNEGTLHEALVGIDFEDAAKVEGKGRTGVQIKAQTFSHIQAQNFVRQMRDGEHQHDDGVLNVVKWGRSVLVSRKANADMAAFRLESNRRPTTFQQIEADDLKHKHDNPAIPAPTVRRKRTVRKRS